MQQPIYEQATPVQPPYESRQLVPFCELSPDALSGVNRSLGLNMPSVLFSALQTVFREVERRDPLVGEVRLLVALYTLTLSDASRTGIGELYTDSRLVAESWADLMARRRLLAEGVPAPCTLPDIVTATDTYLRRVGERPAESPVRVIAEDASGIAAARVRTDGYEASARFAAGNVTWLVSHARQSSPHADRRRVRAAGDVLILLRDLPDEAADWLIGRQAADAVVLHAGCPLPLAIARLCGHGAEVRTEVLCPEDDGAVMSTVAGVGAVRDGSRFPDYLLCLRRTDLDRFLRDCRGQNLTVQPLPIGQAVGNGRLTFLWNGRVLASLTLPTLNRVVEPWLFPVHPDVPPDGTKTTATVEITRPEVTVLPSPHTRSDGTAPWGNDIVEIPVIPAPVCLPDGVVVSVSAAVLEENPDRDGCPAAFRAAGDTVRSALAALTKAGIDPSEVSLSVFMSGMRVGQTGAADVAFGALCGLYRVCADLRLPAPDPCLMPAHTAAETCRLAVCAWACRRVATASSGTAPWLTAVMPNLHPGNLNALLALGDTLERQYQDISSLIWPVKVASVTSRETPVGEGAAPAVIYRPDATAADALCQEIDEADLLVLAMTAEDGEILLSDPTLKAMLETFLSPSSANSCKPVPRLIAVGGVCVTLARMGWLPACLTRTLHRVPTSGKAVLLAPSDGSEAGRMRWYRHDLLAPDAPVAKSDVCWFMYPEAGPVPDGYRGADGAVRGYLNGYIPDRI